MTTIGNASKPLAGGRNDKTVSTIPDTDIQPGDAMVLVGVRA